MNAVCHRLGSKWNVFSLLEGAGWVKRTALMQSVVDPEVPKNLGWMRGGSRCSWGLRVQRMKMWQIFAVGVAALISALLLPLYESAIAGMGAVIVIAAVAFGFFLRPRRDEFYVRTSVHFVNHDHNLVLEHDRLAVRVELSRLWLLFLPTFLALAFLVVEASRGTLWNFSLLNRIFSVAGYSGYLYITIGRGSLLIVVGILSVWISERWVLRDADVCNARSVTVREGRASFMFVDRSGEYYGGEALPFGLVRPAALARLVLYKVRKPELNKIGMGLLFHRLVIVGHGLTELDQETAAAHPVLSPTIG